MVRTDRAHQAHERYQSITTYFGGSQQALLLGYFGVRVLARLISVGDFQICKRANIFAKQPSGVKNSMITLA
jgi:hypothetical protein